MTLISETPSRAEIRSFIDEATENYNNFCDAAERSASRIKRLLPPNVFQLPSINYDGSYLGGLAYGSRGLELVSKSPF